jgi:hypothetical protein
VTSTRLERLARAAYEAHRSAHPGSLPAWEDTTEQEQQAWRAAVSALAGQTKKTVAEAAPTESLLIQVGDHSYNFHTEFTAGRQGTLVISDEFASNHHARFSLEAAQPEQAQPRREVSEQVHMPIGAIFAAGHAAEHAQVAYPMRCCGGDQVLPLAADPAAHRT